MTQYRFLWAISAALLMFLIVAGYAIQRYAIPKLEPLPSQAKSGPAPVPLPSKPASAVLIEEEKKAGQEPSVIGAIGATAATGNVEPKPDPFGPPVASRSQTPKSSTKELPVVSDPETKAAIPPAPPAVHLKTPAISRAIEHAETPAPEPVVELIVPAPIQLPLQPRPPKQATLAQPSMLPSSDAPASRPGSTLSDTHGSEPSLASPNRAQPSLSQPRPTQYSLSRPRQVEESGAGNYKPPAADGQPAPPPLSLPSVTQSGSQQPQPQTETSQPPLAQQTNLSALTGRKLSFKQDKVPSPQAGAGYAVRVLIDTNLKLQPASLVITCDEEVVQGMLESKTKGHFRGVKDARLYDNPKIYWIVFESPALEPDHPVAVLLTARHPIKVTAVTEGPVVR